MLQFCQFSKVRKDHEEQRNGALRDEIAVLDDAQKKCLGQ